MTSGEKDPFHIIETSIGDGHNEKERIVENLGSAMRLKECFQNNIKVINS